MRQMKLWEIDASFWTEEMLGRKGPDASCVHTYRIAADSLEIAIEELKAEARQGIAMSPNALSIEKSKAARVEIHSGKRVGSVRVVEK